MNERQLQRHRAVIDSVDEQILELLNRRIRIASELGDVKRAAGLEIIDSDREQRILRRVCELNRGPLDHASVVTIFRAIIDAARQTQLASTQSTQTDDIASIATGARI